MKSQTTEELAFDLYFRFWSGSEEYREQWSERFYSEDNPAIKAAWIGLAAHIQSRLTEAHLEGTRFGARLMLEASKDEATAKKILTALKSNPAELMAIKGRAG